MEDKKFGELDSRFVGTSLENQRFEYWSDEGTINECFDKIKEEALVLVKVYDKRKEQLTLSYPARYVKGKNGPYYRSICFQPHGFEDSNYSYYEGIYVSCSLGYYSILMDGNDIDEGGTFSTLFQFNEEEKDFLEEIKKL